MDDNMLESITDEVIRRLLDEAKKKKKKSKKKKKKRKVKCPLLPGGKRDYKCEYQKYGGASKKGKKDRAARNKARRQAIKLGLVKKGDGMEIDHIMPLSLGGSNDPKNWQVLTRAENRKKGKSWDGKSGKKNESLRRFIREMLIEAFTEKEVRKKMKGDSRQRRGLYGAHAKDIFRQQAEENPEIRKFLNSLFYMHWADVPIDSAGKAQDPLANKRPNDELSCNAYDTYDSGAPMGWVNAWGAKKRDRLGFQVEGFVTFLEHGDSQSGSTGAGTMPDGSKNDMSGDNKQPRRSGMGRDPSKRDSMADVIQSEKDFFKRMHKRISTTGYGHNEALVDNWELKCIWYKESEYEDLAQEVADILSSKYGRKIPIRYLQE